MAGGVTAGLLYVGCALIMLVADHDGTTYFFNSLLHGLDISGIVHMEMFMWQNCIGFLATLLLGWLTGACVAWIHNMGMTNKQCSIGRA